MNVTSLSQASYNNLTVDLQTSSGDKISLSMYDNKEMLYTDTKDGSTRTREFSLSHSYGYAFEYEGNGIDAQDAKEINNLLKELEPTISSYMENVKDSGIPKPSDIMNKAFEIKQRLSFPKDENHKGMMLSKLLDKFDKSLEPYNPNEDVLKASKSLFDNILKQFQEFGIYA